MRQELRKKVGITEEPEAPAAPNPGDKPSDKPSAGKSLQTPEKPDASTEPGEPKPPAEPGSVPAGEPGKGDKKASPWKLLDQHKAKIVELESKLLESSKLPEQEKKGFLDRIEKAEARAKELEDHIRFVNYSKSSEFVTKYQQPYEKAWKAAMSELKEIPVIIGEGQTRPATTDDLLALVNMPLGAAREQAEQFFGPFANDVMAHRKTLKQLWEAQAQALEDAEKNGAERERQHNEMTQKKLGEIQEQMNTTWQAANDEALKHEKHGKYFSKVEGDEDGNQRLTNGFEMVDKAFRENPKDPNLSPEQRATIIKRQAAVRNRAAAYGRLVSWIEERDNRIAELEKELSEIKSSSPTTDGGGKPPENPSVPSSARDRMHQELRKRAVPQ
jgi:hypothetical protein